MFGLTVTGVDCRLCDLMENDGEDATGPEGWDRLPFLDSVMLPCPVEGCDEERALFCSDHRPAQCYDVALANSTEDTASTSRDLPVGCYDDIDDIEEADGTALGIWLAHRSENADALIACGLPIPADWFDLPRIMAEERAA